MTMQDGSCTISDPGSNRGESHILTIGISTTADRVSAISEGGLPSDGQWRYLLIWQAGSNPEADARAVSHMEALRKRRSDLDFLYCDGLGAARSRNLAIQSASSELLLFSDDDVVLLLEGLHALIDAFRRHPDAALMSGITLDESGEPAKRYPQRPGRMTLFNCARVGTVELAVRPSEVRRIGVGFDERFGAGSPNPLGDEYIFITDCLRKGLKGIFVPIPVAIHQGRSSGGDWETELSAAARARVFERVFGSAAALPVKLAFIWRHRRTFVSFRETLQFSRVFLSRQNRG